MNVMELGATGELVGGVAVIVTLIYLAIQIRHARHQVDELGIATATQATAAAYEPIYYGENFRTIRKGLRDPDILDDDERFLFDLLVARQLMPLPLLARTDASWARDYINASRIFFFSQPGGKKWLQEFIASWPDGELKSTLDQSFLRDDSRETKSDG